MRVDLTCPVELWNCQIPTPEYPVCSMQMFNLSEKAVTSVQVCILCYDGEGVQFARHVERVAVDNASARQPFDVQLTCEDGAAAMDMEILIDKVWMEGGALWRRGMNESRQYTPPPRLQGKRCQVMQEMAGKDAVCFPSDQGNVWVCVCARPNGASDELCRRCGRDKHDVFTKLNQAAVEKIIFKRESEEEEKERRRIQEEVENERRMAEMQRRRKKRRRILIASVVSVLLIAAAAYGTVFHAIPYYRYTLAARSLENGQYATAKAQFTALGEYRDSQNMTVECDYLSALNAMNGGTYTSLQVAQSGFDALGEYKDSAARAREVRYIQAEKYLAAGEWDQAIAFYEQVPDYQDSGEKILVCRYAKAEAYFDMGDYENARAAFLELSGYRNADELAME